jgi:hypothetical protein
MCPFCARETDEAELCAYHSIDDERWAAGNRAACDLIHRGVVPMAAVVDQPMPSADAIIAALLAPEASAAPPAHATATTLNPEGGETSGP